MSVGAVAAILRARAAEVVQQRVVLLAVIQKWTGARNDLHAATSGAQSDEAARSIGALSDGIGALARAVQHLNAVTQHVAAYGPALGVDLAVDSAGPAAATTGPGESSPAAEPPRRPDVAATPREVQRAASRLPLREGDRGPTHGWLLSSDLQPVRDVPLRSGEDLSLTADLDLPARERLSRALTSHVEAKVAAQMRRGEIAPVATLVLNNAVCHGPASCERFLPSILPPGARLTIFVSDSTGPVRLADTYVGTGERIKKQ